MRHSGLLGVDTVVSICYNSRVPKTEVKMWQEIEVLKVGNKVGMVIVGGMKAFEVGSKVAVVGAKTEDEVAMMGEIWNSAVAEAKSKK